MSSALKDSTSHNIPPTPATSISQKSTKCGDCEESVEGTAFLQGLRVPTVILDTASVTHTMAASLSLALLGHTLFLKSQVPFPVAQLLRMPGGGSNPKVAKKREELLATFDTLASHLQTTFVALSTAYAKCKSAKDNTVEVPGDENSQKVSHIRATTQAPQKGTAHLMFVLGPSVGAARARILLTIDGLEVKVWGERADAPPSRRQSDEEDEGSVDLEVTDDEEESDDDDDEDSEDESSLEDEEDDEVDELEGDEDSDSVHGPPASRSPSPSPHTRSLAPSPESPPSTQSSFKPLSAREPRSFLAPRGAPPPLPVPAAPSASASRQTSPAPAPSPSYAEEQAALRAAERLLSRTLMTAWANGGGDMASELAPTQTHVFLRAPRRFAHPAWAARQNLTRTLDGILSAFLVEAGAREEPGKKTQGRAGRGIRTEGAWIGCKGGSAFATAEAEAAATRIKGDTAAERQEHEAQQEADEEDEEIWWAWDGKIVGFADW
ncbi:hypothetical protein C8Q77DRAFT_1214626 [Trametes polyzona]|nr:hypothetical protein C8Q77DRAFT_1214626 [Trametes polyzona]